MPAAPATGEGRILGTAAYMSPEQAEGKPVDARSDLFSLGVMLYEMATGQRPFTGDTNISIISSIVKDTPKPITELNPSLPRDLGRIVRRALAKDPERRYQNAKDLRNDLEELKASIDSGELIASARRDRCRPVCQPRARLHELEAGGGSGLLPQRSSRLLRRGCCGGQPTPTPMARLAIALPEDVSPDPGRVLGAPAISPDGTTVALTFGSEPRPTSCSAAWIPTRFDELPGTDGARQAFWSPDSRHIGFFAGTTLKRVPLAGGEPVTLCEVGYSRGGAWSAAGTILVGTNYGAGVLRVSEKGGAPVPVTRLDAALGENSHRFPVFLPDGNQFLYFARTKLDENRAVYLASLDDSQAPEATPRDRQLRRRWRETLRAAVIIFCTRRTKRSGPSRSIRRAGSCPATRWPSLKTWVCSPCLRPVRWSRDRPRPNRRSSPGSIAEERLSARSGPWATTRESNCLRTTRASRPFIIGRSAAISRSG